MKNAMYHLGPEWALYVVHGRSNAAFVRHALEGVSGVKVGSDFARAWACLGEAGSFTVCRELAGWFCLAYLASFVPVSGLSAALAVPPGLASDKLHIDADLILLFALPLPHPPSSTTSWTRLRWTSPP